MPPKTTKTRRPMRRRLAVIVGSTLMSLLLAEGILRIAGYSPQYVNGVSSFHEHDPVLGRRGKPSFSGRFHQAEFDVDVELDAEGFRQVRAGNAATSQPPRVFVLGDSFAWGWGVERDESFVALAAEQLDDWEWRNYALCGSGTVAQYLLFERFVRSRLEPGDAVLLAFYENDFADNVGTGFVEWVRGEVVDGAVVVVPPPPARLGRRIKNALKDASYLFNLCAYGLDRMKMAGNIAKAQARATERLAQGAATNGEAVADLELTSDSWVVTRHFLEQLKADVVAAGAKLVMVCLPGRTQYGETFDDGEYAELQVAHHRAALRCARELGIPSLDVLPVMQAAKQRDETRLTYEHDLHWKPRGHRVVAEAVVPFLSEHLRR